MSSLQDYLSQNYLVASKAEGFGDDSDQGNNGNGGGDYEAPTSKKRKKKSKKLKKAEGPSMLIVNDDDLPKAPKRDSEEEDYDELDISTAELGKKSKAEGTRKWKRLNGVEASEVNTPKTEEKKPSTDTLSVSQHGLQTPDQVALYLQKKSEAELEMIKSLDAPGQSNETV